MGLRAETRRLVGAYRTQDRREADFLERMRRLLDTAGDPFSRHHFDPGHFTASAFVLSPDGEKTLLLLHTKLARWLQPGGHFEASDRNPVDAARREATEETGLEQLSLVGEGILDVDIHDIPPLGSEPAHAHLDIRFLFQTNTWSVSGSDESQGLRWLTFDEIATVETDESVLRAVERIRSRPA